MVSGVLAGAVALGGLGCCAPTRGALFEGLTHGAGLACVVVSVLFGVGTLGLVRARRLDQARFAAAGGRRGAVPAGRWRSGRTCCRG